jgi:hypothetical protein
MKHEYLITCYANGVPQFQHKGIYASSIDAQIDGMELFGHEMKIVVTRA